MRVRETTTRAYKKKMEEMDGGTKKGKKGEKGKKGKKGKRRKYAPRKWQGPPS